MLNSAQPLINIKIAKINGNSRINHHRQSFILLIHVEMSTIVGILTFMRRINLLLSLVEHDKMLITTGLNGLLFDFVGDPVLHLVSAVGWEMI